MKDHKKAIQDHEKAIQDNKATHTRPQKIVQGYILPYKATNGNSIP